MAQDYRITVKDWIRQATGAQDADEFEQTGITVLSISPFPEAIILAHPPEKMCIRDRPGVDALFKNDYISIPRHTSG